MLKRSFHENFNQFVEVDFSGYRLRHLHDGREIQLLDRCSDRTIGSKWRRWRYQLWILQIHLTNLAVGAPTKVAGPGIAQIRIGNRLKPSSSVESRGHLMGQALILNEAVLASRLYGLFVEAFRVQLSPFEAGDLSRHQRMLIGKGGWIDFGPLAQLFPVRRQQVAPLTLLVRRDVLIECRHRQRGVVKVVEQLDLSGCSREERLDLVSCRESLAGGA